MRTRLTALLLVLLMVSGVAFSEAETVKVEEISAAMEKARSAIRSFPASPIRRCKRRSTTT